MVGVLLLSDKNRRNRRSLHKSLAIPFIKSSQYPYLAPSLAAGSSCHVFYA
ncbi:hypothetical protein HMPREF1604_02496 [Escherichia coli 908519]|nr:hypothetical protein HMPREF1603_04100 [Escherichia coli 907892]ESD40851.1 hypothetical protein HMPREF1604_02496 [Escherichia coli 908519]